jgi:hypothetical protein
MQKLDIEQCKAIAQAEAMGNDFFVFAGKVWDISEKEAREYAKEWAIDKTYINTLTDEQLTEWLEDTQTELEYDHNADYIVYTDIEADEQCTDYIRELLWAFNASFLSNVTGFDISIFKAIQANDKCESNNGVILKLVGDNFDDLVSEAISSDGRGNFLNTYDGNEYEFNCFKYTGNNEYLFVYRVN